MRDNSLQAPHTPYDICIAHLSDARFYPLFKRQAFTLRDAGYRVALVSWERAAGESDPHWEGIDVHPITIPVESFNGKIFFARYMYLLTRLLKRLPARLYQAVDPVTLPSARMAAASHDARYNYFSLEYFQGIDQMAGRPLTRWIWRRIEAWGLAKAINTAVVCRATSERLAARFRVPLPSVIRNVPLLGECAGKPDGSLRRAAKIGPGVPLAVFKGDIGGGRGLVPFIKALARVDGMHLALLGDGPLRAGLESLCASLGITDRVHFLGRVAPEQFPSLLKEADLGHALHENIGTNMPFTLPSKLFDYLHAGLPVLCGNQGEMAEIVMKHRAGWSVDPGDHDAVVRALHEAAAAAMGDTGLRQRALVAAREYCWDTEQTAYLEWIRGAIG